MHVCGNNDWGRLYPRNTQITGNISRTYTSGEKVLMRAHVIK